MKTQHLDFNARTYFTACLHPDVTAQEIPKLREKLGSMLQKAGPKADDLQAVISPILAAIAPTKIYMLQHNDAPSRPAESYIHLLITVSGKNDDSFAAWTTAWDIACLRDHRISCSFHHENDVLAGLRSGHPFYSLNCIPDNRLYDDQTIIHPIISPEALHTIKRRAYGRFSQAFERALDFHESASDLSINCPSPIVPFLLHQAVELTYRGVLLGLNNYDEHTHTIRVLKKHIRCCAPELDNIFPDNTEGESRLLDILEDAYWDARYKDGYNIADEAMTELSDRVMLLQEAAQQLVTSILKIFP